MTDEELKALVAENSRAIGQMREESARQRREIERLRQEVVASRQSFDRTPASFSFSREFGRIGNAFGDDAEVMFRPSLEHVLSEHYGMTIFHSPLRLTDHDEVLEIDMLAYAGDERPEVYVVEIKSQLRPDAFEQLYEHLRKLPRLLSEHRGKKLFGVLAALDIPADLRKRAEKEGLYLATIKDDIFEITSPEDFEPHVFGLRGLG